MKVFKEILREIHVEKKTTFDEFVDKFIDRMIERRLVSAFVRKDPGQINKYDELYLIAANYWENNLGKY